MSMPRTVIGAVYVDLASRPAPPRRARPERSIRERSEVLRATRSIARRLTPATAADAPR